MPRWARSGNTQRHQKTPCDATPWKELSKATEMKSAPKGEKTIPIQKGRIEKKKHNLKRKFGFGDSKKFVKQFDLEPSEVSKVTDLIKTEAHKGKLNKNKKLLKIFKGKQFENDVDENLSIDITSTDGDQQMCQSTNKYKNVEAEKNDSILVSDDENITTTTTKVLTKKQLKKAKRKLKLQEVEGMNSFECLENLDQEQLSESNISYPAKVLGKKKKRKGSLNEQEEKVVENSVDHGCSNSGMASLTKKVDTLKLMDSQTGKSLTKEDGTLKLMDSQAGNSNSVLDEETHKSSDETEVKLLTKNQWRKARRKKKLEQLKAMELSKEKDNASESQTETEGKPSASEKDFAGKKKLFLEKLQRKRQKNGITLLPAKVERKIYNIKRALREKGLPAERIKDIARTERRREELKFTKTFGSKPCFNCRKIGHLLSDCPLPLGTSSQATGICFKCGSTEHVSYKCPKKVEGYPLAKCFVCKEQGHISKDCPKNERGVYIKGGKCSLCGNVNHLRKDCPSIKKEYENVITVDTINDGISVDAEIIETAVSIPKKKFNKKQKVVKF